MITALLNSKFFIMKKQFLNLGKALSKAEQKLINGGNKNEEPDPIDCADDRCPPEMCWGGSICEYYVV